VLELSRPVRGVMSWAPLRAGFRAMQVLISASSGGHGNGQLQDAQGCRIRREGADEASISRHLRKEKKCEMPCLR